MIPNVRLFSHDKNNIICFSLQDCGAALNLRKTKEKLNSNDSIGIPAKQDFNDIENVGNTDHTENGETSEPTADADRQKPDNISTNKSHEESFYVIN